MASLRSAVILGVVLLLASGARAQEDVFTGDCYPACREGFVCNPATGQCVSACNPPCAEGEQCTADGRCLSTAPAGPAATPAPHGAAPAESPPVVVGSVTPAPAAYAHAPVSFLLRVGPTFGWFSGGTLSLGLSIRLAAPVLLDLELRGAGGGDGSSTYALGAGEATVRFAFPRRITWTLRGGVGAGFLGEWEVSDTYDYAYRLGYVRLGSGVLFMSTGRREWGIEGSAALGSAVQVENHVDFEDHGGFYGEFQILGAFTF